ncbi:MAG TPA: mechanosensitive ion channel family protein [Aequorivita sp.]|jgi:small conductance mechanosensitive channel|nr:mechanosensitive ion channel protein MscS [Aequorivita sp.]MBP41096.1 mechanosensitive ion channel protein MscS [Aequorivita sp.]HBC04184.1 mechanosensitive ion channel protein MscS [Aequorivita sp.]HNP66814.1 mechanosensitive ion channel family protein [Aequorivita sp.]|tara:strand:+ start:26058 stop:26948 length:891 start_codon:yes stop_codon:yes gene_type:complete
MSQKFSINDSISNLWDKLDGWLDAIILKLPNFAVAILVMVAFYFIAKGMRKFSYRVLFRKITEESIKQMLSRIMYGIVLIIGFFIALGVMQLDKVLTSVLAGAGVVGLAIGLALQGTLSNTFSGLMLSFLPKVRIGDFIEAQDKSGYVDEINLRNITLRQTDNEYVIIPNSIFIENPFTNYSLSNRSRIDVSCGVGYESNLQKVEDLVNKIITENFEQKENEGVEFFFTEFGDSSINFVTRFWISSTKPKPKLEAKHKAIKLIKKNFDEAGINIPFPIRTLDFGKNKLQMAPNKDE